MEEFQSILITDILPNPYQPRRDFDAIELEELADSIKENGIIQPIIVRKSEIYGFELIAGERRLRASALAGLTHIPAIVKNITDQESQRQAIVENLQRSNLNPIEEAKAYLQLKNSGLSHDDIAKQMGKSRPYISNSLRLMKLPPAIQKALENKSISPGHARLLIKLDPKQQAELFEQIQKQGWSVRDLEKQLKKQKNTTPKNQNTDPHLNHWEEELKKELGLTVQIKAQSNQKGKIILAYHNLEEFNRIINKLK